MTGMSRYYFNSLEKVFPHSKHVYLTRDPVEVCESIVNLLMNVSFRFTMKYFGYSYLRSIPSRRKKESWILGGAVSSLGHPLLIEKLKKIRNFNLLEYFVLNVMVSERAFRLIENGSLLLLDYSDLQNVQKLLGQLVCLTSMDTRYPFDMSLEKENFLI